jgi:RecB family exonuclease
MLAGRIAELVDEGQARAGEVVLLLRAVGDLDVYERALRERGLRTLAAAGGFWASQQVGDLIAYLRALANPLDEVALYGTLASPLVGLSSDGLALLARASHARARGSVWALVEDGPQELLDRLGPGDRALLVEFRERFSHERRTASAHTISQLIERAVEATGYQRHVLELDWGERRLANIHKLLRLARGFEASEGRDLRGFLDHAERLKDAPNGAEPDAPVAGVEPEAVRLMSIHAAKGLEFPVVCVADLGRAVNLTVPDLLVDGERLGLRLARLEDGSSTPSLDFEELCEERNRAQAQEEDRILYVAMTRARERLLLSGAVDFERWPQPSGRAPMISWLGPALSADLPALVLSDLRSGQLPVRDLQVGASGATVRCRLNTPDAGLPAHGGIVPGAAAREESSARGGPSVRGEPGTPTVRHADRAVPIASAARAAAAAGLGPVGAGLDPASAGHPDPLAVIDTLSYTTLSELDRCGYRYYLERVLGLPEVSSVAAEGGSRRGLQARARGTLVHRLLESLDFASPSVPSPERVALLARELGMRVPPGERREIAALVGAVAQAARSSSAEPSTPARRVAVAQSVRREHPFAFSLGPREPLLMGVIDLLAREADGGFLILDYKSDRVDPEADLAALVEHDYGIQRLIYALAVLRDGAPRVEIVHWFLERREGWVAKTYGAADRSALEDRLAGLIARARSSAISFSVSEHPHRGLCESCPGRARLCSWSEADTMGGVPSARGLLPAR